jgi:tellurite resistance protein TerA
VSLAAAGTVRVNLTWNARRPTPARPSPRGDRPATSAQEPRVDLDLGCLYELTGGRRGVVQAIGDFRGDFDREPYIRLDRDDRTGSSAGENMFVNAAHLRDIRRILIFVFAYSGSLDAATMAVTVEPVGGTPVQIDPGVGAAPSRACAVALLTSGADGFLVQREARYIPGYQADLDRLYGWGLRWGRAGPK